MKVDRINHYKEGFIQLLINEKAKINMDKYQFLESFSENWDIETLDFKEMMDASFESAISGRLWGGSKDSMKSEMLRMIEVDKEFVRVSFHNLFQEGKDLGLRLDRFLHHLDELYRSIKKKDLKAIHHEHKRSNAVLYLVGAFPEAYCLHEYSTFHTMMEKLESRNIPQEVEIERYYKSMRAIYKILTKDPQVQQAFAMRCAGFGITFRSTLLLMNDFADYVSSK